MLSLPTWLTLYLSIGTAIVLIGSGKARRDKMPRSLSWVECAAVVLLTMTTWSLWAVAYWRKKGRR